jgi:hypothetical protein
MRNQFLFKTFILLLFYVFSSCGNNNDDNGGPTEAEVKEVITRIHEWYNPAASTEIKFEKIKFGKPGKGVLDETVYPVQVKYIVNTIYSGHPNTDNVDRLYNFARNAIDEWEATGH